MKKIVGMLVATGILLAFVSVSALANPLDVFDKDSVIVEKAGYLKQYKNKIRQKNPVDADIYGEARPRYRTLIKSKLYNANSLTDDGINKYLKIRGVWGFAGDNESDGYFAGRISRRGRFAFFNGLYNKTDDESYGKLIGIMKKGYFNGVILNSDEDRCIITGLYKINKEDNTFKMRWITPYYGGWAAGKTIPS
jgi:hypothetical protein